MVTSRGRAGSPIRVPQLVRDYLAGTVMGPEDSQDEAALRPQAGDYIAHIHQRVKARIKELEDDFSLSYQYPRSHSFASLIANLLLLGLLERTGQREEPEERGAGQVGTAGGFEARTYVRLAPGWQGRPEWRNPMAYVAALYAGLAPPEAPAPSERPPLPQVAPRRRRPRAPSPTALALPPVMPLDLEIGVLEARRSDLVDSLRAAESATTPALFRSLLEGVEVFLTDVHNRLPGQPFPAIAADLSLLRNCVILLERSQPQGTAAQAVAVSNCQNSARILAETLSSPLVAAPGAPTRRGRPPTPPTTVPALSLPARVSARAVERLQQHLKALAAGPDPDDPAVRQELERLANVLGDWSIELEDTLAKAEGDRAERLQERIDVLNEAAQALQDGDLEGAAVDLEAWL